MKKLLKNVFSIKNEGVHKVVKICGLKLKLKSKYNRIIQSINELKTENEKQTDTLYKKIKSQQEFINKVNFLLTKGINKERIIYDIENFKDSGINEQPRTPKLIVSLTSFPERMYDLHFCLYSLLTQTLKPDEVILWLAAEEFPNKEADLPQKVLQLKDNGLTIKWCENIASYKKLIPAIKEYTNDIIVSADDDIFYPSEWLERLYNSYLKNPDYIHCHRAHKITFDAFGCIEPYEKWKKCIEDKTCSFLNFATTGGGILYPPNCFYKDILNEDIFTQLAPRADDIWFWAMCVLNNKKIKVIENSINQITYTNPARELQIFNEKTLYSTNGAAGGNDEQLKNIFNKYTCLKDKLNNNHYVFELYNDDIYSYILFLDHKFAYDYVKQYINKNSRVLEIGCGDGYGTDYIADYCERIDAVDISESAIKKAQTIYKKDHCNFYVYDGKNLEFGDKTFDVVFSFHVIEHVDDVKLYLNNIKRVLKDSGKFILTTPSRTHRLTENQKPWNKEHLREYNSTMLNAEILQVFENYQIYSVTANQEILDIEFDRVAPNRADFNGVRKNINKDVDYKNIYSINDFKISSQNLDSGLDLMVIGSKFNSANYWRERYLNNGNSGAGSYGRLAQFKADVINSFVKENNVKSVIEYGFGDGNQLSLFNFEQYLGFDVSDKVVDICRQKFKNYPDYVFKNLKEYKGDKAELVLSLDVVYHLIEDEIFDSYMKRLFASADKFVIIYSSNKNEKHCTHVKHRKFTDWIDANVSHWKLLKFIPNKYTYDANNQKETSFADFYIYSRSK